MKQEDNSLDLISRTIAKLTTMSSINEKDYKSKLLSNVKKEVKQVMEESVTKKYVHEDSGSVTALCAAVEACLSQGLRRRALGLFKTSSTTALLHKAAKHSEEAAQISLKVQQMENNSDHFANNNKRSSSSSESLNIVSSLAAATRKQHSLPSNNQQQQQQSAAAAPPLPKYLWIRLALFDKQLAKIIDHLVGNAQKYYDKDALVADPDYGNILSSLLVGPCALDYSRNKALDYFWADPHADELVQRKMICNTQSTPPPVRRPINFKRVLNTSAEESSRERSLVGSSQYAKDYVESLHQNPKDTLLFGKNNVLVLPSGAADPMPGYLSLHQSAHHLTIKWTPNQLINGLADEVIDKSVYWDFALQIRLDEIVYVHCHCRDGGGGGESGGGTVILVGQDGVQRPHIQFPKGGHTLAFLSCIETGLLPRGRLDPPLWSQQRTGNRKTKRPLPALATESTDDINRDYVFRIIDNLNPNIPKRTDLMDPHAKLTSKVRIHLVSSSTTSSESSTKSFSIDAANGGTCSSPPPPPSTLSTLAVAGGNTSAAASAATNVCNIRAVCDSMKRQIISRAFYGWLAYCRHLSTVRTHLSGLVNHAIVGGDDERAARGIDADTWRLELNVGGVVRDGRELFRATYYGGIGSDALRKEIWPYLLGHFKVNSTEAERDVLNEETRQAYENTMSEWLAVEAIVKQRDKESTANAIAKLNHNNSSSTPAAADTARKSSAGKSGHAFEDGGGSSDERYASNEDLSSSEDASYTLKRKRNSGSEVEQLQQQHEYEHEEEEEAEFEEESSPRLDFVHEVIVTNASVDMSCVGKEELGRGGGGINGGDGGVGCSGGNLDAVLEEATLDSCLETHGLVSPACVSPASSNGGVYTSELLETFGLNLHRIEKDVQRCDRNFWYFASGENLDKLRNIMCTYVWEHLDIGYMQGMCDLVAPLLVIFNDESLTYACFCHLMERMVENFPNGNAMDCHFANMRSLIQILDAEMYELMHAHGDYTHFYFCYRWFLLDFKRELLYDDVYRVWETIWAATRISSSHFVLFLALAFLETYRDIILSNSMDFTDIIKFFNEMAEHHDAGAVIKLARDLVLQLQLLIENK